MGNSPGELFTGQLASRRTLGGHRRYARTDIEDLVERLDNPIPA
jgi:hypothetical protein